MPVKKGGAFYVSKKDGILRSTITGSRATSDQLKEFADAAGYSIEKEIVKVKVRERRVKVFVPVDRDMVQDAITAMPQGVKVIVQNINNASSMNEGIREMVGRWTEFRSVETAIFAGIAMEPKAREFFTGSLDEFHTRTALPRDVQKEVIVGGGLHAAIYCAMRVRMGFPPPVVLEQEARAGGVFAVSKRPSFFLNSRNRPGNLSVPGEKDGTLNFLPGAVLQPSDICSNEYITNETMAWVIRLTLALNAKVVVNTNVENVEQYRYLSSRAAYGCRMSTNRGRVVGERVIYAQGLGKPNRCLTNPRLLSFEQFMARMDDLFPLRDVKRVAVIGNGDGAKTVIESLVGLGPQMGMSVAALDWPTKIDWYGPDEGLTCDNWQITNRTRYAAIAGSLQRPGVRGETARVVTKGKLSAEYVKPGYNCILLGERPYDLVVDCTGIVAEINPGTPPWSQYTLGGRCIAFKDTGEHRWQIGAALGLSVGTQEAVLLKGIAENSTSLFRYAGRTAQLAELLN